MLNKESLAGMFNYLSKVSLGCVWLFDGVEMAPMYVGRFFLFQ